MMHHASELPVGSRTADLEGALSGTGLLREAA